jgi:inosine-uridine nucleoside N-ribohydrolase
MKQRHRIITLITLALLAAFWFLATEKILASRSVMKIIIDTDAGVDDAAAIAWLLSQDRYPVDVLGITAVTGNTSVENVANNVLIVLDLVGRTDVPVIIGAAAPLYQAPSSTGAMIHGPDGLWFAGFTNPHDLSGLARDVPAYYCDKAAPDVTLLMLGPLTNLAQALEICPETIQQFGEIVVLGGAKGGGNRLVHSEFNIWYDPEAAAQVISAGLNLTVMPLPAFGQFTLDQKDIDKLAQKGNAAGQFLAAPIQIYANMQTGFSDEVTFTLPDVPATIFALNQSLASSQPALVKIVAPVPNEGDSWLLRGQTLIGLEMSERITMIAEDAELSDLANRAFSEPGFNLEWELFLILMREPDNAEVVTSINAREMQRQFMRALTK